MADAPVTPLVTTIEKDITWVRAHVIVVLLAIALIAGSIIGGISLFESMIERHDARVAAAQLQKEGVDTATQAALVSQLNQDRAANTVRDAAQAVLMKSLISQMVQQHEVTDKQVAADATLNARAAADRLVLQTKASPSDVTVINDSVTMTLPLTRTVVADLDLLPQAQSDLTNLQGQLGAQKILTSDSKVELDTANKIIYADKVELIATIKADNAACDVRVDQQVAKDRKRGFWLTVVGVVGGFVLRGAL